MIKDQADKLRQMIENLKPEQGYKPASEERISFESNCRVITVTSGKGGVGKTSLSVNLGIQLSKLGNRVVILDADFGLANVDILFGITPKYTLLDVINSNKTIFDIITEGPFNVKFLSGGSGLTEMASLKKWQLELVIKKISSLDSIADIVIIDTGAGVAENVKSFLFASDEVILVTSPEPTAIMDAYAMVKTIALKDKNTIVKLVVNRAKNLKESTLTAKKLSLATEKFLGIKLQVLGHLLASETVIKAVKEQQPFVMGYPKAQVSIETEKIAERLITNDYDNTELNNSGFKGFINRFSNFINI